MMGHHHQLSSWWLAWLVVAVISAIGPAISALTPLVHMTNHCHKNLYVNDSLVLDLTDTLKADRVMVGHLSCAVTLRAPSSEARLYLHVLQLAISDHAQMPDRLHIYDESSDGTMTNRLTPSTGLYGVMERPFYTAGMIVPDFRSAGPRMRLDYQGKPTIIYRGFRVLVTVFYSPAVKGGCRSGTVHCPYAGTCVPLNVRCDSFPNCGLDDNSDEKSCQREYVVSNILDEYSTRTAVIAAATGIVVFLGVAALVLVFLIKYTRKKYGRGRGADHQSARYTSRAGGASRHNKDETDPDQSRLYAPPSYEDVMTPRGQDSSLLGVGARYKPHGGHRHQHHHRHFEPPPAYSDLAAAAQVHHSEPSMSSDDDDDNNVGNNVSSKRPATLWSSSHPPPPPSQQQQQQHLSGACSDGATAADAGDGWEEEKEDVRMHGTWPSDTDEEEEVRARRRKKGGRCKGKHPKHGGSSSSSAKKKDSGGGGTSKRSGLGDDGPGSARSDEGGVDASPTSATPSQRGLGGRGGAGRAGGGRTPPSLSTTPEDCSCDASPSHRQACPSSRVGSSDVPGGGGAGGEAVSETESSQLVGSKRNSRTESNSPDTCSSSSGHSDSPAKQSQGSEARQCAGSAAPQSRVTDLHHLRPDSPSSSSSPSIHPLSPSVLPLAKLSSRTSSEDSLPLLHKAKKDPSGQNGASEEDLVDLNPARSSGGRDCVLHS